MTPDSSGHPSSTRRALNKARTRAAILEASLAAIAERGLQATTMDQIAAASGVARATLFNYFPSKTAIVDALVAESDAGFLVAIENWCNEPGLGAGGRLLGLFAATARYLQRTPARRRALVALSWLHWSDERSIGRIRATRAAFARLLAAESAGPAATIDVDRAAELICDAYMGLVHSWWIEAEEPVDERFDGAARMLARMIDPGARLPASPPLLGKR